MRGYAFDPSLSTQLDTAVINETVYRVQWEEVEPGPVGEYIEVIDYDPASKCCYAPVDLENHRILAQDGLPPSEGSPQFHQQFVYAVVMTTIANFERALGRPALWSARDYRTAEDNNRYVQRLRVYPHALREPNAYYSPDKKALLFGYFPASHARPDRYLPGGTVFTCLSHDIIAHETTHALLDGMHQRFIEANNADGLAFHEAFADIVALFQRFSFPDVLEHQIRRTRGDLSAPNLLGELAQQFGEAIGNYGALRSAIGRFDETTKRWEPMVPNPDDYETTREPHGRGAILVAAIFDAFIAIYRRRVADLMRLASNGTGVLPEGELHPDLIRRLSAEAAKSARQVLNVCIRALDYCPPVDITFSDYLRAIVTADADTAPDDKWGYRIAFIEAFRRRGIYPNTVRTLSVESLLWKSDESVERFFKPLADNFFRPFADKVRYVSDRRLLFDTTEDICKKLHDWITGEGHEALKTLGKPAGLTFQFGLPGLRGDPAKQKSPNFQVHSVRPARQVGPDGNSLNQLVVSIIQSRDLPVNPVEPNGEQFAFRGGCTFILNLDTMRLRYMIAKDVTDEARLARQQNYRIGAASDGTLRGLYFKRLSQTTEPFAALHNREDAWSEVLP